MKTQRIGILGTGKGWHSDALVRALQAQGHEAIAIEFRRTAATVGGEESSLFAGGVDLLSLDGVIVRSVPAGSLEQVIFRVDALHRLELAGIKVLNPARAIEASVDKYLSAARLAAAGLPVPRTTVCESAAETLAALDRFGGRAVIKPLFGAEGRGIVLIENRELGYRAARTIEQLQAVAIVQEFIDGPGYDIRAFVLGNSVIASMRRFRAPGDFRTNVSQGGRAETFELSPSQRDLALAAARAVGAPLAGVDLIPGSDGVTYLLELNSSPGFRALSSVTGIDVAGALASFVLNEKW